jgi:hypothetical protein
MPSSALAEVLLMLRLEVQSPFVMDQSLHPLLARANSQSKSLIVLTLLMTQGMFFVHIYVTFLDEVNDRAHIARWCAESNRPFKIVEDREFRSLMKAGRPGTSLPSSLTVSRDIKATFKRCRERIDTFLKVSPGPRFFTCH